MNAQMLESLKGVNSVMSAVNGEMNPQQMAQIMKEFAKETEKMGMQQEMMQDQFDMMGDPETCLLYTSPSPRDLSTSRMPSSA